MKTAIILCGGKSSRMGEPKHMVKVKGKTIQAHQLGWLKKNGIEQIFFAEKPDVGTSGAIYAMLNKDSTIPDNFYVINGDIITNSTSQSPLIVSPFESFAFTVTYLLIAAFIVKPPNITFRGKTSNNPPPKQILIGAFIFNIFLLSLLDQHMGSNLVSNAF